MSGREILTTRAAYRTEREAGVLERIALEKSDPYLRVAERRAELEVKRAAPLAGSSPSVA